MQTFILATLLSLASAQFSGADRDASLRPGGYSHDPTGDVGQAYVHNPDWDLTPFQLYKLRKQGKSAVDVVEVQQPQQPVQQAVQPVQQQVQQAAPRRQQVKVVRRPAFRQAAAAIPAAPVRQAAPAPVTASGSSFSQNLNFQNFPSNNNQRAAPVRVAAAPVRAAPVRVSAAPVRVAPAPVAPQAFAGGFQQQASVPQTPQFIAQSTGHPDADFWRRAYAYAAPTYAAKAEGSSYTYEAIF